MSNASNLLLPSEKEWFIHRGDCIPHMMDGMPPESVDFAVFSPPFPSVYAYTDQACDIGNTEDLRHEAKLHFSFFFRALRRVVKPGRVIMLHCTNIVRMKRSGGRGTFDFRGLLIRLGERAGLIAEYDWVIRKNPQSQAIRTKSRELQFAGLEADRAKCRGAMPDFLLKFMVPGENAVPICDFRKVVNDEGKVVATERVHDTQVPRNSWIDWAESAWMDINETDTLNVKEGKGENDTKHICPLQLEVIRRLVKLYTNPDEIVFSPFAGIGSELHTALSLGRRAYGCEIKPEYYAAAEKNCKRAVAEREEQQALFA